MFVWNFVFIISLCIFIWNRLFNIFLKVMTNKLHQKVFNYVKNKPNYKPSKTGMSESNLANFATFRGCNLARNLPSQVFFCSFLYASPDSTNQQETKRIWEDDVRRCAIWHGMAHIYFYHAFFVRYQLYFLLVLVSVYS